ncbi:glycoside hydrolase family 2 protein [Pedobacter frigoris]|uniref:Glycoside hydrolase family 2 n=1 Tax=Pedobacter frigoris TaxID=2571272 RepID=A0A4U1CK29_9SPHI|nr:glycoside hydrolase family 2 [Pedobacter frigoris]TKC06976.1 glycoside hydrolase family 2 [Pedobacter frigoris]
MARILFFFLVFNVAFISSSNAQDRISLAGTWTYSLDTNARTFNKTIQLPGTLDDAAIGEAPKVSPEQMSKEIMIGLWRKNRYVGVASYKREITIPAGFSNKNLELYLERVIWKTSVWVDDRKVGDAVSLSAPQTFRLPQLAPGKHTITLRIDNRQQFQIGDATHAYTDGTQIIWNGVIGKMQLVARQATIEQVSITPDVDNSKAGFNISVKLPANDQKGYRLQTSISFKGKTIAQKSVQLSNSVATLDFPIANPVLCDEFNPALYTSTTRLTKNGKVVDEYKSQFGMRKVTNQNSQLQLNGKRIFLRGTLECNIFPLTGHPPMDKAGWLKVMTTAKQYGLNHLRFHSWCPPEAAFAVADSMGMYLQVELPLWTTIGKDKAQHDFLNSEADLILKNYGNHPSFCFFSMGNELEGNFVWLNELVKKLKSGDKRRLYATTSFSFGQKSWPQPQDDFYITQWTVKGWVRGQGIFNDKAPAFNTDYTKSIDSLPVPIVTHEIGQYSVYPNIDEIKKYTGVLTPLNFMAVRNDLSKKGLLPLAKSYLLASGKLSANLYKEEIERALKTPGFSGFQLLDLHDFPGQSTALVGLLDAFWESKGIISAKEFSSFCGPVVPLLRFKKADYTNDERFTATAEIANFLNKAIQPSTVLWEVTDAGKKVVAKGEWRTKEIPVGNENVVGQIDLDLSGIVKAEALTVSVSIKNTDYKNQWNFWVYPAKQPSNIQNVSFTTSIKEAIDKLQQGETVLLNPDTSAIKGVAGRFAPVFWSPVHFPSQPGSMGLLINDKSAAFANFPTENYTNWQWWDLVTHSKSLMLDSISKGINPLVRVIDNFFKNRKMGTVIEAKLGKGKLIICSMDIHTDLEKRTTARQLRYSLMKYASEKSFEPELQLTEEELKGLFK